MHLGYIFFTYFGKCLHVDLITKMTFYIATKLLQYVLELYNRQQLKIHFYLLITYVVNNYSWPMLNDASA